MWQLLTLLALWLGMEGVGGVELTTVQRRGLQVALEEFHKHPPVQWAFQETSVDSAEDTVSGCGHIWLGGQGLPQDQQNPKKLAGERPPAGPPSQLCWLMVHSWGQGWVTEASSEQRPPVFHSPSQRAPL